MTAGGGIAEKLYDWVGPNVATDTIQRLNYCLTFILVLVACGFIGAFQDWSGLDIMCTLTSELSKQKDWTDYARQFCYYGNLSLRVPAGTGERFENQNSIVHYPYIIPFFLQAFAMTMIIVIIWNVCLRTAGSIECYVYLVIKSFGKNPAPTKEELNTMSEMFINLFGMSKTNLVRRRLFIQLLNIIFSVGQSIGLNYLIAQTISPEWLFYTLRRMATEWFTLDHYFPRTVWCDLSYSILASTRGISMQCSLPLMIWYNVFSVIFSIFLAVLSLLNIIHFFHLTLYLIPACLNWRMAANFPNYGCSNFEKSVKVTGADGCYILTEIGRLTSSDYAARLANAVFQAHEKQDYFKDQTEV